MKTVLVVEDDRAFRRSLRLILEGRGFKVIEAINGNEGIQAFAIGYPDFVITDLNLPFLPGTGLVSEIKAFNPRAVVIAVSGDAEKLETARALGADAIFCKPFQPEELFATLDRFEGAVSSN